jgi:nucleoid-associated protein YgaU
VKLALPLIPGVALLTILGIGCATQKEPAASSALDIDAPQAKGPAISRTPPVYTPPPARVFTPPPQPAEAQPAEEPVATPAAAAPAKPLPLPKLAAKTPAPATARSDGTYTVQKGDTLFKIAKERYGSGTQWEKIAAANPGVNATSLKVGQKLRVP